MGALAVESLPDHQTEPMSSAAFAIDGQIVLIDTAAFKFDGYTPAVVIRADETIGIEKPVPYGRRVFGSGPRISAYGVGRLSGGRFQSISPCTVIGRVISQN